mgnify:CR=1 FL=1
MRVFFRLKMEYSDGDPGFRARFLEPKFQPESFVQSIGNENRYRRNKKKNFMLLFLSIEINW